MEAQTSNSALWDEFSQTNPAFTKDFKRSGGFSGTAINPTHQIKRLTEKFGPIGFGWYYEVAGTTTHTSTEGHIVVYRDVNLYVCLKGEWSKPIHGCGGDFVVDKNKYGLKADDEAYKKAETDALGNAMKKLGMSADVHLGMFDDNKYVNDMRAKFGEAKEDMKSDKAAGAPPPVFSTTEARKNWLMAAADEIAAMKSYEDLMSWIGLNGFRFSALGEKQTAAINEKLDQARTRLAQSPVGTAA